MRKQTRREFLESAVFGAIGAGGALAALQPESLWAGPQATVANRSFTSGRFGIELDGIMAGWLHSAEGGHATSDVVAQKMGTGPLLQKHIAGVKYEDITVSCGTGMSRALYEWIKASVENRHVRKDGAVTTCDYDSKEMTRLEWTHGLISEVGFPALDAASKDAAKLTLKITPETTRAAKGSGKPVAGPNPQAVQKKWLPANFRLKIGDLDCSRVNKIEALTIKQKVVENPTGEMRDYQKEPANVETPNLVITFPESDAKEFHKWHEDFVIKGNNGANSKKNGQLDYLSPDLEALFTLMFTNLSIFKLTPDKVEAGHENIRRVKIEMRCESMKFLYSSSVGWA